MNKFLSDLKFSELSVLDIKNQVLIISLNKGDIGATEYSLLVKDLIEEDLNQLTKGIHEASASHPYFEKTLDQYRQLVSAFQKRIYLNTAGGLNDPVIEAKVAEIFLNEKEFARNVRIELKELLKKSRLTEDSIQDNYIKLFLSNNPANNSSTDPFSANCENVSLKPDWFEYLNQLSAENKREEEKRLTFCYWQLACAPFDTNSNTLKEVTQSVLIGLLPRMRRLGLITETTSCLLKVRNAQHRGLSSAWNVIPEISGSFRYSADHLEALPTFFF